MTFVRVYAPGMKQEYRMTTRTSIMICFIMGLAACGAPDAAVEKEKFLTPSGDAVNVTFTDKAKAKAVLGFSAASVYVGPSKISGGGSGSSSQGNSKTVKAECKIIGDGYSAEFTSPAIVNMPSMGRETPPVDLICTYSDKEYKKTFEAINLSKSSRDGAALVVGVILCPICGVATAIANGGAKDGDAYGFDTMFLEI